MNACSPGNAAVVSAVAATAAAQCNSEDDLELMAAIFTVISDFMAAILAQRAFFQADEQQKQDLQDQQSQQSQQSQQNQQCEQSQQNGQEEQSKDAAP